MKRSIQYIIIAAIVVVLAIKSVYFKKLSEMQQTAAFNAENFVKELWDSKLPARIQTAVPLSVFRERMAQQKDSALKQYTHALAIGNYRYVLVQTTAQVVSVNEDDIVINIPTSQQPLRAIIASEYIYGNAIRDASGLIDPLAFPDTDQLNAVSAALNQRIRSTVAAPFKSSVKAGDEIDITAAIEINKAHVNWDDLELLPVRVQIK